MTTAFQPSAFQNNAFQIDGVIPGGAADGSGVSGKHQGRDRKKKRKQLQKVASHMQHVVDRYNAMIREAEGDKQVEEFLISAVDPYVYPETEAEFDRRMKAIYIFDTPPPVSRINFQEMVSNPFAAERFEGIIEKIMHNLEKSKISNALQKQNEQLRIESQLREEDDILLFSLAALSW